jgi:hypothetical protein
MPMRRSEVATGRSATDRLRRQPGPDDSSSSALAPITSAILEQRLNLSALIRENVGLSFRPFRYILRHEEVPHGDAPIEVAEVGGAGKFSQFVVPDRFFPVMIRLARWVLHNPCSKRILFSITCTESGERMSQ